MSKIASGFRSFWGTVLSWWDNSRSPNNDPANQHGVDWGRVGSFVLLHAGCLGIVRVGWSPIAVAVAAALYFVRIVFVTGFYHRYFSHKTFKTSRAMQFVMGVLGNTAVQRGPLWWAAHHRHHHRYSDEESDPHSPVRKGFWTSHIGWITLRENFPTRERWIPDLLKYPELRFLDRFDTLVPFAMGFALYFSGEALARWAPSLGTNGWQLLVWGMFVSTTLLFHVTALVNSGAHTLGRRRFPTKDTSRNSWIIAILTAGEGWHNNHHHYPASARNGFYWWEVDVTYYVLRTLAWMGLIWDLNPVPRHVLEAGRSRRAA